jgi:hypothetical protein
VTRDRRFMLGEGMERATFPMAQVTQEMTWKC